MCVHINRRFIRSQIKSDPFKTNIPQGNFSKPNVTYLNHVQPFFSPLFCTILSVGGGFTLLIYDYSLSLHLVIETLIPRDVMPNKRKSFNPVVFVFLGRGIAGFPSNTSREVTCIYVLMNFGKKTRIYRNYKTFFNHFSAFCVHQSARF